MRGSEFSRRSRGGTRQVEKNQKEKGKVSPSEFGQQNPCGEVDRICRVGWHIVEAYVNTQATSVRICFKKQGHEGVKQNIRYHSVERRLK